MPDRHADALEVLLPDAAPQFWQRAQRVTTFLRLMSDDARAHGGASIAINLSRARGEFERSHAARLVRSQEELLRHHLYALLGSDSFAHFGECDATVQAAWSELEEERAESPWLPEVPAPCESAQSVATRLLAGLERAGAGEPLCELWRARLVWAGAGPRQAASSFEAWLERWGRAEGALDLFDHHRRGHACHAAVAADVAGHAFQGHDRHRARLLGDARLGNVGDVHDHAAAEHAGEALLEGEGAGGGGAGGGVHGGRWAEQLSRFKSMSPGSDALWRCQQGEFS